MAVIVLKKLDVIPVRFNLWVMLFTSCWVVYMLRVNMSLNIIAMVPQEPRNTSSESKCGEKAGDALQNGTLPHVDIADVREAPRQVLGGGSFNWTAEQQALILGSYFWSYPFTSLIGGMAAERWGPRYVVVISSAASGILTAMSPAAARMHYLALVVVRFLLGLAGGFIYPSLHVLVARWAPPAEKGKFVSAMMGGTLGTVVTWSLTGPLVEKCSWPSAFYVPAVLTMVWCLVWWYLVADTPDEHPRITDAERKYILDALGDKVKKSKGLPPLKSIFTSIPFLAMVVLHYGNLWGLYFIMTVGPKFVSSVLGFELSAAGVISALPYLARLFFATIFGVIGDCILAKNIMTTTTIRKFFSLFSHIIPGALLVLLVYVGCSTALSVTLIALSMGFNGAATLTNLQNHQDLAPNYAGTLYGIANFVGSTAGFFTPMITAYYTSEGNSYEDWRPVFFIGASVYIVSAIFFIIFGTGLIQEWNFVAADKSEEAQEDKSRNGELKDMKDVGLVAKKIGVMIFLGYFLIYVVRYNLSVHIIDMAQILQRGLQMEHKTNSQITYRPALRGSFNIDLLNWDDMKIARLFSAYHIGFFICFPIFHNIGDSFGPTWVVGAAGLISGILNCLTPSAAYTDIWVLFLVRIGNGFCAGAMQPSMVQVLRHWVPPIERNHFMWAYCGITMGTFSALLICAVVQFYSRWPVGFYVTGGCQIVWAAIWVAAVTDKPQKHACISNEELEYLDSTIGDVLTIRVMNSRAPWKLILRSGAFWALCILNYGYAWMIISLGLYGPMYYSNVIKYRISVAAALTALPFILRFIFGTIAIQGYYWYKHKSKMKRIENIRKYFIVVSHVLPGLLVCSCWLFPVVPGPILLTISVAMTAAGMDLTYDLCYELAPNYGNSLNTVIKIIGNTPGILVSYLVGIITQNHGNTPYVWKHVWCFHALLLCASGAIFLLWGETQLQPWNSLSSRPRKPLRAMPRPSIMSNITEIDEETASRASSVAPHKSRVGSTFRVLPLSKTNFVPK